LPLLSEAGTDRDRALEFADQYELVGAKQLAPIKGVNRNVKLNLVSEAFMRANEEGFDLNNPYWHMQVEKSSQDNNLHKRIFDIMMVKETREVFGLTYHDFLDMDRETFDYIAERIFKMAKDRMEAEKRAEQEAKFKNGTKH